MIIGDWINVVLCVLSFVLAAISVVTVVITLRQNNKMIESSTRAYIAVSGQSINVQSSEFLLVVKNYGNSSAIIENITFDIPLKPYMYALDIEPFSAVTNATLCPNQNIVCNLNPVKMGEDNITIIHCTVTYTSNGKKYVEKQIINFEALCKNVVTKANTKGKELKIISYALQEMLKKNL